MSADVGHVDRGISTSGMVENVGAANEISLISHASPGIQCTSGLNAAILFSDCRQMSVNVDDATVELGMCQNMGGSRWNFADSMSRKVIMLVYSKMADFRRIFPVFQFRPPF